MRKLSLVLFVLLCFQYQAQVWCTPGSTWRFNHFSMSASGYKVLEYQGDTMLAGKLCNKLYERRFTGPSNFPPNYFNRYYYTYVNNDVVYLLDQTGGNFDTLYNFKANIGDQWRLPPVSHPKCAGSHVTVTDTGHVIIQGQSLRSFTVSQVQVQPRLGCPGLFGAVYERIGATECYPYYPYNMCSWSTDSFNGGPLHCFADNQIIDYKYNFTGSCDMYVSVSELKPEGTGLRIYPSPGQGLFQLEMPVTGHNENISLAVTDLSGRQIKFQSLSSGKSGYAIDLSQVENGVYLISVYKNNQVIYSGKVLKN
jgi:hypothetical protein